MKWTNITIDDYESHINSSQTDSFYLRENGLKPFIIEMIGNAEGKTILDSGCGESWIARNVQNCNLFECDIVDKKDFHSSNYSKQDVTNLNYQTGQFDKIVACLLLIFVEDYKEAINEFYRTLKPNGELIIAITNPYFYRTGQVIENNRDFQISENLSKPFSKEIKIDGEIGPLKYHYRPLTEYINTLVSSSFKVTQCFDWFIDIDDYNEKCNIENNNIKRSEKTPLYTFIKCTKL